MLQSKPIRFFKKSDVLCYQYRMCHFNGIILGWHWWPFSLIQLQNICITFHNFNWPGNKHGCVTVVFLRFFQNFPSFGLSCFLCFVCNTFADHGERRHSRVIRKVSVKSNLISSFSIVGNSDFDRLRLPNVWSVNWPGRIALQKRGLPKMTSDTNCPQINKNSFFYNTFFCALR